MKANWFKAPDLQLFQLCNNFQVLKSVNAKSKLTWKLFKKICIVLSKVALVRKYCLRHNRTRCSPLIKSSLFFYIVTSHNLSNKPHTITKSLCHHHNQLFLHKLQYNHTVENNRITNNSWHQILSIHTWRQTSRMEFIHNWEIY